MLRVFCDRKGSGKTKFLIDSANEMIKNCKGNLVYIDDDKRPMFDLDRRIRFISTDDYDLKHYNHFYGFLCGILSEDYDISAVYIDGLFNIIEGDLQDAAHFFYDLEKLSQKYNVDFYISINSEKDIMPDFVKKYVAW